MIAATAVSVDLPVYTCNPRDFSGIDRLQGIAGGAKQCVPARDYRVHWIVDRPGRKVVAQGQAKVIHDVDNDAE